MTEYDETRREWNDVHALSGAYAVDALDDIERARFEEHLRLCPDCRTEIESLRETAAVLAVEPVAPPPGLRADVLAGIESIRPLPPLTQPGDRAPAPDKSPRRPWLFGTGPLLVAAALVLVALVTTVWQRPWADDAVELTAAEQVIEADDAQEFSQRLADGSEVSFVVSRSEARAVLLTDELALAPDGKDYQLWLQTPDGALVSAGLVPDDGGDGGAVLLEGDASSATGAGLSVEPDGGSEQPTVVLALVDLPA